MGILRETAEGYGLEVLRVVPYTHGRGLWESESGERAVVVRRPSDGAVAEFDQGHYLRMFALPDTVPDGWPSDWWQRRPFAATA